MMRFFVSPGGQQAVSRHQLDVPLCGPFGWHDCTDMTDAEFDSFVTRLQRAHGGQA